MHVDSEDGDRASNIRSLCSQKYKTTEILDIITNAAPGRLSYPKNLCLTLRYSDLDHDQMLDWGP